MTTQTALLYAVQVLCDLNFHLISSVDAYSYSYVYKYNFNCWTSGHRVLQSLDGLYFHWSVGI